MTVLRQRNLGARVSYRARSAMVMSLSLVLVLVLSACTPQSSEGQKHTPTDTSVLVVGVASLGTQNFAPWLAFRDDAIATTLVGDTLTRIDPKTHNVMPGLAESWQLSADQKTWTFKLRAGVPFHGGFGTVTAEDVKFSWDAWIRKDSAQPPAFSMRQAVGGDIKNFEVVSPLEFRLHTTTPLVALPLILSDAYPGMPIQSKAYFAAEPEKALKHPLGSGPFKFVSATKGVEIVLESVGGHPFRSTPAFKKLILREIPDDAARLAEVRGGTVDIGLQSLNLLGEARAAGLDVRFVPDTSNCAVTLGGYYKGTPALDTSAPWIQADPTKGLAIRQAMSLAIDRATILERIMGGAGSLTHGTVMQYPSDPRLVDRAWSLPAYDPVLAKQKLAEGGYPNGFEITFMIYAQITNQTIDIGEAVAGMWAQIGIKVKREKTEQALMRPKFSAANRPVGKSATNGLAWVHCSPRRESPEISLETAWRADGLTIQGLDEPAISDAYSYMSNEADEAKRYARARALIARMAADFHPLSLFTIHQSWVAGAKVGEWTTTPGRISVNSLETVTPKYR